MAVERQTEYETIYILRPNVGEDDKATARDRVTNIVADAGGHTLKFDDWGTRRLAYRIRDSVEAKHHEQGLYQYFRYLAHRDTVAEIERNLRILDPVIKYMTVRIEEDLIPEERLNRPEEEEE
jgi:small subunit ribosomal protein S6